MLRKVLFLLCLPLLTEVLISCCNCAEPIVGNYRHTAIEITALDNSGKDIVVAESRGINRKAFGLRLNLIREMIVSVNKKSKFNIISSANAMTKCKCQDYSWLPSDTIKLVTIHSLKNFDENHDAGSDITGYMKVYRRYVFQTIPEYLAGIRTIVSYEGDLQVQMDLLLMEPPISAGKHQFKISVFLSDGRILEQTTPEIDLL